MDSRLASALANLKPAHEGRTRGVAELVESIKSVMGLSYAEIARIAKCSPSGLTDWRTDDIALTDRLKPLVQYAKGLIEGSKEEEIAVPAALSQAPSLFESICSLRIMDLEKEFERSLKQMLGASFQACHLTKLENGNGVVKLELVLT